MGGSWFCLWQQGSEHCSTITAEVQNYLWNGVLLNRFQILLSKYKIFQAKEEPEKWQCKGYYYFSPLLPPTVLPASLPAHPGLAVAGDGLTHFDPLNAGPGHGKTHSDTMRLGVYFTQAAGGQLLCLAGKAAYLHRIPTLRLSIKSEFSDVPRKSVH